MSGYVRSSSPVWTDRSQLSQDVVSIAFECIRTCDLPTHVSPAVSLLDRTRRRLRMRIATGDRQPTPFEDSAIEKAGQQTHDVSTGADLDQVICQALKEGALRAKDAELIFTSRVLGVPTAEIAALGGRNEDAVRRQRNRAERGLIARYDGIAG